MKTTPPVNKLFFTIEKKTADLKNIISFPSELSRSVRNAPRNLTARVPKTVASNVLQLPKGRPRSKEDVRRLFTDTYEILQRVMPQC